MNSNLQTTIADVLVAIEPWGNELWFLAGIFLITLLSVLAFANSINIRHLHSGRLSKIISTINTDNVFIGLCVFTVILLRLPGVSRLELAHGDEGGLIAGALTLLQNPRFWLSVDNTTIGPVSTFSLTVIHLLGGTINYGTIKLLGIFVWILSVVFMFRAFVNFYGSQVARLAVLPVVACVATFNYFDYVAFNGEHMPVLLLAASVWFFSKMETQDGRQAMVYALLTGFVLGLLPYSKVQAAPIAAAFGFMLVLLSLFAGNRKYIPLIVGGLIPTVLLGVYLVTSGAFEDFRQSYILNNLTYASEGFFGQTREITLLSNVAKFPAYLLKLTDTRYYFLAQFAVILAGTMLLVVKQRSLAKCDIRLVFLAWIVVIASIYSILLPKNNWTHYLLLLIVPLTLLYGSILGSLQSMLYRDQQGESTMGCGSATVAALLLITVLMPASYVLLNKNIAFEKAEENSYEGKHYSDVAMEIFKYAKQGERIAVWGFAYYYEETGMAQGTREAHTERQMTANAQQAYYTDRWIRDLNSIRPPILLEALPDRRMNQRLEFRPEVKLHVDRAYRQVARVDYIKVYVLKERLADLQ